MDRPSSPEKELSPEEIPDLNVKSYYGEHIPAVQDDFGVYSYSDSSTSPETFNGGVSNLSEDSLDNRLISSGLAEESEVPIIESTNVYNDSLCDVTNSTRFIDDILGNLGPNVSRNSGVLSSGTESELDRDDESNSFSCGESRCSCDGCQDSSKESCMSPLAMSDDSSFTSSCDSFDYPFLQTNTEYLDTKLTLSSPDTQFSIPKLVIKFPPMVPENYIYNKDKEKWKLKKFLTIEIGTVVMTARELSFKREKSKMYMKEFPSDIVFPNVKLLGSSIFREEAENLIEPQLPNSSDKISNSLCDPLVSNKSPSSSLLHESSGNIPLIGLLSPTGVPPVNTDIDFDPNEFVSDIENLTIRNSLVKKSSDIPYSASELSEALKKLESVQYSLESNGNEFTHPVSECLNRPVPNVLNYDQRNNTENTAVGHIDFPTTSRLSTYDQGFVRNPYPATAKAPKSSNLELSSVEPSSNIISVGENVITCKNPGPFSESYSIKNYDDNCSPKDSNPNSVEDYKNHAEDSQDGCLTRHTLLASPEPTACVTKDRSQQSNAHINQDILAVVNSLTKHVEKESKPDKSQIPPPISRIESNIINDAALLYRLANSFESFNNSKSLNKNNSVPAPISTPSDMPSLSPEPEVVPSRYERSSDPVPVIPPTLTPQTLLLDSEKSVCRSDLKSSVMVEVKTKTKEEKQRRKQNKEKINHMLPKQEIEKQLLKDIIIEELFDPKVPDLIGCDLSNFKPEIGLLVTKTDARESLDKIITNVKPVKIPQKAAEDVNVNDLKVTECDLSNFKPEIGLVVNKTDAREPPDKIITNVKPIAVPQKVAEDIKVDVLKMTEPDKNPVLNISDTKKHEKKSQSIPKSFILGKVFPKNRVTKTDKSLDNPLLNGMESKENGPKVSLKVDNPEKFMGDMIKSDVMTSVTHCEGKQIMKISDKNRIVVSMVGAKNSSSKPVSVKCKDGRRLIDSKTPLCKTPSICSRNHKLIVFKKNPSLLDKSNKKLASENSVIGSKNSINLHVNGYKSSSQDSEKSEIISSKEVKNHGGRVHKTETIPSPCDKVLDKISPKDVITSTPISNNTLAKKSAENKSRSENLENQVPEKGIVEKALYPKTKTPLIRQRTESVVAEADSTGSDTSLIDENRSEIILNKGANLIIQKDSTCNKVGVSNEILLKKSDSVRLLLDPGNLSRDKCYTSMVITVATAEISCINELDPPSVPAIPIKQTVSTKSVGNEKYPSDKKEHIRVGMEYVASNAKSDNLQEVVTKVKKEIKSNDKVKNDKQSEKKLKAIKSNDSLNPTGDFALNRSQSKTSEEYTKTEEQKNSSSSKSKNSGSNSNSPVSVPLKDQELKYVDSVSSTSNGDSVKNSIKNPQKTKDEIVNKNVKEKNNKKNNFLENVTNLRKRSASCGSTGKRTRRNSSDNLKKGVCEILCRIELDSIRNQISSKTFSLSDTCVSSICDKDSTKKSDSKSMLKSESMCSLKVERNDSVEVSSSTSPGKDERDKDDRMDDLVIPNVDVSLIKDETKDKIVSQKTGTSKSTSSKTSKSSEKKVTEFNGSPKSDFSVNTNSETTRDPLNKTTKNERSKSDASIKLNTKSKTKNSLENLYLDTNSNNTSRKANSNPKNMSLKPFSDNLKSKSDVKLNRNSKDIDNENSNKKPYSFNNKTNLKKSKSEILIHCTKTTDSTEAVKICVEDKSTGSAKFKEVNINTNSKVKENMKKVKSEMLETDSLRSNKDNSISTNKSSGKTKSDEVNKTVLEDSNPNTDLAMVDKREDKLKENQVSDKRSSLRSSSSSSDSTERSRSKDKSKIYPHDNKNIESVINNKVQNNNSKDRDLGKKLRKDSKKISEKVQVQSTKESQLLVASNNSDAAKNRRKSRSNKGVVHSEIKAKNVSADAIKSEDETKVKNPLQSDSTKTKETGDLNKNGKNIKDVNITEKEIAVLNSDRSGNLSDSSSNDSKSKRHKIKKSKKPEICEKTKNNLIDVIKENQKSDCVDSQTKIKISVKTKLRSEAKLHQDLHNEMSKTITQFTHIKTKAALKDFGSSIVDSKQNDLKLCDKEVKIDCGTSKDIRSVKNGLENISKTSLKKAKPITRRSPSPLEKPDSSKKSDNVPKKKCKIDNSDSPTNKKVVQIDSNCSSKVAENIKVKDKVEKSNEHINKKQESLSRQGSLTDLNVCIDKRSLRNFKSIVEDTYLSDIKISDKKIGKHVQSNGNKDMVVCNERIGDVALDNDVSKDKKLEKSINKVTSNIALAVTCSRGRGKITSTSNKFVGNLPAENIRYEPLSRELKDINVNVPNNLSRLRSKSSPPPNPDKRSERNDNSKSTPAKESKAILTSSSSESVNLAVTDRKLRSSVNWGSNDSLSISATSIDVKCTDACNPSIEKFDNPTENVGYNVRSSRRSKSNSESADSIKPIEKSTINPKSSNNFKDDKNKTVSNKTPNKFVESIKAKDSVCSTNTSSQNTASDIAEIPLPKSPPISRRSSLRSNKLDSDPLVSIDIKFDVSEIPLPVSPPPSRRSLRSLKISSQSDKDASLFTSIGSPTRERKIAYKNIMDDNVPKFEPSRLDSVRSLKSPVKDISKSSSRLDSKNSLKTLDTSIFETNPCKTDPMVLVPIISDPNLKEPKNTNLPDSPTLERRSLRLQEKWHLCFHPPSVFLSPKFDEDKSIANKKDDVNDDKSVKIISDQSSCDKSSSKSDNSSLATQKLSKNVKLSPDSRSEKSLVPDSTAKDMTLNSSSDLSRKEVKEHKTTKKTDAAIDTSSKEVDPKIASGEPLSSKLNDKDNVKTVLPCGVSDVSSVSIKSKEIRNIDDPQSVQRSSQEFSTNPVTEPDEVIIRRSSLRSQNKDHQNESNFICFKTESEKTHKTAKGKLKHQYNLEDSKTDQKETKVAELHTDTSSLSSQEVSVSILASTIESVKLSAGLSDPGTKMKKPRSKIIEVKTEADSNICKKPLVKSVVNDSSQDVDTLKSLNICGAPSLSSLSIKDTKTDKTYIDKDSFLSKLGKESLYPDKKQGTSKNIGSNIELSSNNNVISTGTTIKNIDSLKPKEVNSRLPKKRSRTSRSKKASLKLKTEISQEKLAEGVQVSSGNNTSVDVDFSRESTEKGVPTNDISEPMIEKDISLEKNVDTAFVSEKPQISLVNSASEKPDTTVNVDKNLSQTVTADEAISNMKEKNNRDTTLQIEVANQKEIAELSSLTSTLDVVNTNLRSVLELSSTVAGKSENDAQFTKLTTPNVSTEKSDVSKIVTADLSTEMDKGAVSPSESSSFISQGNMIDKTKEVTNKLSSSDNTNKPDNDREKVSFVRVENQSTNSPVLDNSNDTLNKSESSNIQIVFPEDPVPSSEPKVNESGLNSVKDNVSFSNNTSNASVNLVDFNSSQCSSHVDVNTLTGIPASSPLYEAIIANTNDYALVSPASDTVAVLNDNVVAHHEESYTNPSFVALKDAPNSVVTPVIENFVDLVETTALHDFDNPALPLVPPYPVHMVQDQNMIVDNTSMVAYQESGNTMLERMEEIGGEPSKLLNTDAVHHNLEPGNDNFLIPLVGSVMINPGNANELNTKHENVDMMLNSGSFSTSYDQQSELEGTNPFEGLERPFDKCQQDLLEKERSITNIGSSSENESTNSLIFGSALILLNSSEDELISPIDVTNKTVAKKETNSISCLDESNVGIQFSGFDDTLCTEATTDLSSIQTSLQSGFVNSNVDHGTSSLVIQTYIPTVNQNSDLINISEHISGNDVTYSDNAPINIEKSVLSSVDQIVLNPSEASVNSQYFLVTPVNEAVQIDQEAKTKLLNEDENPVGNTLLNIGENSVECNARQIVTPEYSVNLSNLNFSSQTIIKPDGLDIETKLEKSNNDFKYHETVYGLKQDSIERCLMEKDCETIENSQPLDGTNNFTDMTSSDLVYLPVTKEGLDPQVHTLTEQSAVESAQIQFVNLTEITDGGLLLGSDNIKVPSEVFNNGAEDYFDDYNNQQDLGIQNETVNATAEDIRRNPLLSKDKSNHLESDQLDSYIVLTSQIDKTIESSPMDDISSADVSCADVLNNLTSFQPKSDDIHFDSANEILCNNQIQSGNIDVNALSEIARKNISTQNSEELEPDNPRSVTDFNKVILKDQPLTGSNDDGTQHFVDDSDKLIGNFNMAARSDDQQTRVTLEEVNSIKEKPSFEFAPPSQVVSTDNPSLLKSFDCPQPNSSPDKSVGQLCKNDALIEKLDSSNSEATLKTFEVGVSKNVVSSTILSSDEAVGPSFNRQNIKTSIKNSNFFSSKGDLKVMKIAVNANRNPKKRTEIFLNASTNFPEKTNRCVGVSYEEDFKAFEKELSEFDEKQKRLCLTEKTDLNAIVDNPFDNDSKHTEEKTDLEHSIAKSSNEKQASKDRSEIIDNEQVPSGVSVNNEIRSSDQKEEDKLKLSGKGLDVAAILTDSKPDKTQSLDQIFNLKISVSVKDSNKVSDIMTQDSAAISSDAGITPYDTKSTISNEVFNDIDLKLSGKAENLKDIFEAADLELTQRTQDNRDVSDELDLKSFDKLIDPKPCPGNIPGNDTQLDNVLNELVTYVPCQLMNSPTNQEVVESSNVLNSEAKSILTLCSISVNESAKEVNMLSVDRPDSILRPESEMDNAVISQDNSELFIDKVSTNLFHIDDSTSDLDNEILIDEAEIPTELIVVDSIMEDFITAEDHSFPKNILEVQQSPFETDVNISNVDAFDKSFGDNHVSCDTDLEIISSTKSTDSKLDPRYSSGVVKIKQEMIEEIDECSKMLAPDVCNAFQYLSEKTVTENPEILSEPVSLDPYKTVQIDEQHFSKDIILMSDDVDMSQSNKIELNKMNSTDETSEHTDTNSPPVDQSFNSSSSDHASISYSNDKTNVSSGLSQSGEVTFHTVEDKPITSAEIALDEVASGEVEGTVLGNSNLITTEKESSPVCDESNQLPIDQTERPVEEVCLDNRPNNLPSVISDQSKTEEGKIDNNFDFRKNNSDTYESVGDQQDNNELTKPVENLDDPVEGTEQVVCEGDTPVESSVSSVQISDCVSTAVMGESSESFNQSSVSIIGDSESTLRNEEVEVKLVKDDSPVHGEPVDPCLSCNDGLGEQTTTASEAILELGSVGKGTVSEADVTSPQITDQTCDEKMFDVSLKTTESVSVDYPGTVAVLSPEVFSSPSEILPISPLTAYNTSDTDSPSIKDIDSPLPKSVASPSSVVINPSNNSVLPSKTVVESCLDVTVVNPMENSIDNFVGGISKTSHIDVVVVSPSGKITQSLNNPGNLSILPISDILTSKNSRTGKPLFKKRNSSSLKSPGETRSNHVSTEEEILNHLMSSVVGSQEIENAFTDGSESENSPKSENSEYFTGEVNLQLSPHSLEIANYRKRKIRAMRETDFVKRCKQYSNSENIIIHSSEDESGHEREALSANKLAMKKPDKIPPVSGNSSTVVRSVSKPSNPYSKVFYHKRKQVDGNEIDKDFSFKNLFSYRKRSSDKTARNAKTKIPVVKEKSDHTEAKEVETAANNESSVEDQELSKTDKIKSTNPMESVLPTLGNDKEPSAGTVSVLTNVNNDNLAISSNRGESLDKEQIVQSKDSNIVNLKKVNLVNLGFTTNKRLIRSESVCSIPIISPRRRKSNKRSHSLDSYFNGNSSFSVSDFSKQDKQKVSQFDDRFCKEVDVSRLDADSVAGTSENRILSLKEVHIVLERIDCSKYLENSASDRDNITLIRFNSVSAVDSGQEIISQEVQDVPAKLTTEINDPVLKKFQGHVSKSNGEESSDVTSPVKHRLDNQEELSNNSIKHNGMNSDQQSSNRLTDSAPPSSSRSVSPIMNEFAKKECFIKLTRLSMNNLRCVMQANSLRSVNTPTCFLNFKDESTKVKHCRPSNQHYIQLIDEGAYFKIILIMDSFEIFHLDNEQVRHHHLNIDVCRCPFSKKFKMLRGWKLFRDELNKAQNVKPKLKPSSTPVNTKRQLKLSGHKMHSVKSKHSRLLSRSQSKSKLGKEEDCENKFWSSNKTKLNDNEFEKTVFNNVRTDMLPQESPPSYVCHRPVDTTSDFVADVEPASPSMFPVDASHSTRSAPKPIDFDIFSVKGMIKQRKGEVSSRDYESFNLSAYQEDAKGRNFEETDHVIPESFASSTECIVQPSLLSEELSRCPLLNYGDFVNPRTEELERLTDFTQDLLVNSYFETQAVKNVKERAVLSEIERTLKSNKRTLESDPSKRKRVRLEDTLQEEAVPVNKPSSAENSNTSSLAGKGQTLRLKDTALLMPAERGASSQESSGVCEKMKEHLPCGLWPERIERRQKKVSKRREMYLKEQQERQEHIIGSRQISVSKIIGVALNHYPSHVDISRTFNLDMVQEVQGNQNRILSLTKEGASEQPVRVVDNQASEVPHHAWVLKRTPEERLNVHKSLSRLHQRHPIFMPPVLSSKTKTDQVFIKGVVANRVDDINTSPPIEEPDDSQSRNHLMRHNWSHIAPGSVEVFDPNTIDQDSPTESTETDIEDTAKPYPLPATSSQDI